jgi:predicted thioredoxin/glutaredoxin
LRDDVDGLVSGETEELRDDGGGGELDEDNVVESDAVEGVLESHAALDLVGLDHRFEDVLDLERLSSPRKVVRNGENGSEIVGGVTPLSRKPA